MINYVRGFDIYQHAVKITSIRVLDTEESKIRATVIANGKLKDIRNIILLLLIGIFVVPKAIPQELSEKIYLIALLPQIT